MEERKREKLGLREAEKERVRGKAGSGAPGPVLIWERLMGVCDVRSPHLHTIPPLRMDST